MGDINEYLLNVCLSGMISRILGTAVRCELLTYGILVQVACLNHKMQPHWKSSHQHVTFLRKHDALRQIAMIIANEHAHMAVEHHDYLYACGHNMLVINHIWPDLTQQAWDRKA